MESRGILALALKAPLPWRSTGRLVAAASEGSEDLSAFEWDALFVTGEDGPRLRGAPPPPFFAGAPAKDGETADLVLEAGDWAFVQDRTAPRDMAELSAAIERFARDLWWEGTACEGPLYVRGVFEDGRRAVQLWRRVAT